MPRSGLGMSHGLISCQSLPKKIDLMTCDPSSREHSCTLSLSIFLPFYCFVLLRIPNICTSNLRDFCLFLLICASFWLSVTPWKPILSFSCFDFLGIRSKSLRICFWLQLLSWVILLSVSLSVFVFNFYMSCHTQGCTHYIMIMKLYFKLSLERPLISVSTDAASYLVSFTVKYSESSLAMNWWEWSTYFQSGYSDIFRPYWPWVWRLLIQ